jgi:hypothetical protein
MKSLVISLSLILFVAASSSVIKADWVDGEWHGSLGDWMDLYGEDIIYDYALNELHMNKNNTDLEIEEWMFEMAPQAEIDKKASLLPQTESYQPEVEILVEN